MPGHINLNVYQNEYAEIKIRLNLFEFLNLSNRLNSIQNYMLKMFNYRNPDKVIQDINCLSGLPKLIFKEKMAFRIGKVKHTSWSQSYPIVIYQLPNDPYLALDLLTAVHFHTQDSEYDTITFEQILNQEEMLDEERRIIDKKNLVALAKQTTKEELSAFLQNKKLKKNESPVKKLAEVILELGEIPGYERVRKSIEKIIDWHNHNLDKDFHIGLMEERINILEKLSSDSANLDNPRPLFPVNPDNIDPIFQLTSDLIAKGEKSKLSAIIHHQNVMAKRKLYAACIGQKSGDGGRYTWHYPEWALLEAAEFCLRPDGKISIKMQGNSGFKNFYQGGGENSKFLQNEMRYLGKVLGLTFDENTNFYEEIIFSEESSKKLMSLGLHLNVNYFNKLVKIRNTQIPHGIFSGEDKAYGFSQIALDVQKAIYGLAYPDVREQDIVKIMKNPKVGSLPKKISI